MFHCLRSRLNRAIAMLALGSSGNLQADGVELEPGLVAVYRSLSPGGASLSRIDQKPAFSLGDTSAHPRLAPGPLEVVWSGVIELASADRIRFGAFIGGELELAIDGSAALKGRGEQRGAWIEAGEALVLTPGLHPLRITFRSLPGVSARIQLWWEGERFSREPLPAWPLQATAR